MRGCFRVPTPVVAGFVGVSGQFAFVVVEGYCPNGGGVVYEANYFLIGVEVGASSPFTATGFDEPLISVPTNAEPNENDAAGLGVYAQAGFGFPAALSLSVWSFDEWGSPSLVTDTSRGLTNGGLGGFLGWEVGLDASIGGGIFYAIGPF